MEQAVFGLIGAGHLANAQHLPNLIWAPHVRFKMVCDLREELASAAQKKYNIPCMATDHRKVLADAEIDAVVICTKDEAHAPLTVEALEAGKHVYVEKPLADTRAACESVVAAQKKAGRHVAVGFNRRFSPAYRKAKELLDAHGGAWNIHYRLADSYRYTWGKDYPLGSRIFHEVCHIFDLLRWLTGSEPESVYCVQSRADDEVIAIRFASGTVASIMSSGYATRDLPKESLEIIAEEGGLIVENFVEMWTYGFPEAEDDYRFAGHVHPDRDFTHRWMFREIGAPAMRALYKRQWTLHEGKDRLRIEAIDAAPEKELAEHHAPRGNYDVDKGWRQAIDHFAECVAEGRTPETATARDGLIAHHMAEAAARSRQTGGPVRLTSDPPGIS